MRTSDFHYDLPEDLIAQVPLADRSASRLLVLHRETGEIEHRTFLDALDYLQSGDLLVTNDTRVTAIRLFGHRETGGRVELLLLRDCDHGCYVALCKPSKRVKPGDIVTIGASLDSVVLEDLGDGMKRIELRQPDYREQLARAGQVPLPPYITHALADPDRYQTVYAATGGSAAAPTAGLHFTPEILRQIAAKGVGTANVTLDVGLDTFRPMNVENIEDHVMHGERCSVLDVTAQAIKACQGRVFAVGTTTVRTLESFAIGPRQVESGEKVTSLYITPGYKFQAVDALFTNFHMPGTTLMLLVSAFAGRENVLRAYQEAVAERYRFLSFGDAMLIV